MEIRRLGLLREAIWSLATENLEGLGDGEKGQLILRK